MLSASEEDGRCSRGSAAAAPGGGLQHCAAECADYEHRYIETRQVTGMEFFRTIGILK